MRDKKPKQELCEWSKAQLREHFELLEQIVAKPKYVCPKCGRAANAKKWLCKAKKLPAGDSDAKQR
jgi:lipopolysaccharide biosynthesis regulator YciM